MTQWVAGAALEAALNGLIQGVVLTAFVWALLRLFPRLNAATRYAVWFATLLVNVALVFPIGQAHGVSAESAGGVAPQALLTLPSGSWQLWVLGVWAVLAAGMLARLAVSYFSILRLKRRSRPLVEWESRFAGPIAFRRVRLRGSADVAVPMAVGMLRPVVLVPESLLERLSAEEIGQVLVHELAHLRRRDDWTNLVQKLLEAVLFFHPVVRWIGGRLNLEREIACDDWVVSVTGKARPYAACLTHLVELNVRSRSPQLAHGVAGRTRQIACRIDALLSRTRVPSPAFSRTGLAAGAGALAIAVLVAGRLAPVAVAEPPLPAIAGPTAAAPAVAMAYAKPLPAPAAAAPPKPLAVAARAAKPRRGPEYEYVMVRQWLVPVARDPVATVCVFTFRGPGQVVTIIWRRPAPVRVPTHRA